MQSSKPSCDGVLNTSGCSPVTWIACIRPLCNGEGGRKKRPPPKISAYYYFFGSFGGGSGKRLSCTHPEPEPLGCLVLSLGVTPATDRAKSRNPGEGAPIGILILYREHDRLVLEVVLIELLVIAEFPAKDGISPRAGLALGAEAARGNGGQGYVLVALLVDGEVPDEEAPVLCLTSVGIHELLEPLLHLDEVALVSARLKLEGAGRLEL